MQEISFNAFLIGYNPFTHNQSAQPNTKSSNVQRKNFVMKDLDGVINWIDRCNMNNHSFWQYELESTAPISKRAPSAPF